MGLIWVFYNTYTPQATKSNQKMKRQGKTLLRMPFFVFFGPYMKKFQNVLFHEKDMSN